MEPGTGLTILGATIGSAKIIEKILGPTADYLGEGLKHWTEQRINNTKRIFEIAAKRLGPKINDKGAIPPKILKGILDQGSYCDDVLSAEYFGGVLASSRSEIKRDDRGAYLLALLSRLSTYQVRSHYIFYRIIKNIFNGKRFSATQVEGRLSLYTFLPLRSYISLMDFSDKESTGVILDHVMFGLVREALIDDRCVWGSQEELKLDLPEIPLEEAGIVFSASALGVELFLWAFGHSDVGVEHFLDSDVNFPQEGGIDVDNNRDAYACPIA